MKNQRYKITKEQLEEVVLNSFSVAEVCRKLNIRPCGGNYKTLYSKFVLWNLDISHFTGQGWNTGLRYKPTNCGIPLASILVENSVYTSTNSLKKRLFREGLKSPKCEVCSIEQWNNKKLSFELEHINGINTDNRIENLQILCPNCHSQTSTFRGRNQKSVSSDKKLLEYNTFKDLKPIVRYCCSCKKELNSKQHKYCSVSCLNREKSKNIPTKNKLVNSFKKYRNFVQVGKFFNVSDNTIRKWCKKYNILKSV